MKQRIYDAPFAEKFWCIVWSIRNECNCGDYDCHYGCILGDICGKNIFPGHFWSIATHKGYLPNEEMGTQGKYCKKN
ncbi:MAG TPA: hypothetical protein VER14_03400 [Phototrophicaceae bacterium]|nr:hypothetical protein [Phototrophicaceae bacterium]